MGVEGAHLFDALLQNFSIDKHEAQKYIDVVGDAIKKSTTHGEMLKGVAGVIGKISAIDDTVGQRVEALSIF